MPSPAELPWATSRPRMPTAKAAASAPSSSSPPAPRISCKAPRASPPPGSARSIAAMPNGNTPWIAAVGRSIRLMRSRSSGRRALSSIMFYFCSLLVFLSMSVEPAPWTAASYNNKLRRGSTRAASAANLQQNLPLGLQCYRLKRPEIGPSASLRVAPGHSGFDENPSALCHTRPTTACPSPPSVGNLQ